MEKINEILSEADNLVDQEQYDDAKYVYQSVKCMPAAGDDVLERVDTKLHGLDQLEIDRSVVSRFQALFQISPCSVYKIRVQGAKRLKKILYTGELQLLQQSGQGNLAILKLARFNFPLTKAVPVLNVCPGSYVVPTPDPSIFYGLLFDDQVPDAYSFALDSVLTSFCSLRFMSGARREKILKARQMHRESRDKQRREHQSADQSSLPDAASSLTVIRSSSDGETEIIVQQSKSFAVRVIEAATYGVAVGTRYAAKGVTAGSNLMAGGVALAGQSLKSKMKKADQEREVPAPIGAAVKAVSKVTPHLVFVSEAVLNTLVDVALATAEVVGQRVGRALSGATTAGSGEQRLGGDGPKMNAARELGRTTLDGIVNVLDAMDEAAMQLYTEVGATAVDLAAHRYGDGAADTAMDVHRVGSDLLKTKRNINGIAKRKLLRKAAKKAASETAKQYFLYENGEKEELLLGPEAVTAGQIELQETTDIPSDYLRLCAPLGDESEPISKKWPEKKRIQKLIVEGHADDDNDDEDDINNGADDRDMDDDNDDEDDINNGADDRDMEEDGYH